MFNNDAAVFAVDGADWETTQWSSQQGISVMIAHPDEVIRTGLESLVTRMPQVSRSHVCQNWAALTSQLSQQDNSGLSIISHRLVRNDSSKMTAIRTASAKVVLLLRGVDNAEVVDAADLHPDGFLVEGNVSMRTLGEAMRAIWRDQLYMPPELTKGLLDEVQRPSKIGFTGVNLLTPRERDTLKLLAEGCSNKQIATRLGISINGVKRHVGNVLAKLNCPNRTLAAAEAVRLEII